MKPENVAIRFWSKVERGLAEECWPWRGRLDRDGYGETGGALGEKRAHRTAYILARGPIPDGLCVCHDCDNPKCCNPGHLFLGTQADNQHDRYRKGRYATGNQHWAKKHPELIHRGPIDASNHRRGAEHYRFGKSKLSPEQVRELRQLYEAKTHSLRRLGSMFGISHSNARLIGLGLLHPQYVRRA